MQIFVVTIIVFSFHHSKPWIPFEYHNNMDAARNDYKAEMWAYATTLWEIFSGGHIPAAEMVSIKPISELWRSIDVELV